MHYFTYLNTVQSLVSCARIGARIGSLYGGFRFLRRPAGLSLIANKRPIAYSPATNEVEHIFFFSSTDSRGETVWKQKAVQI